MLSAACFHNTCTLRSWADLRAIYEPGRAAGTRRAITAPHVDGTANATPQEDTSEFEDPEPSPDASGPDVRAGNELRRVLAHGEHIDDNYDKLEVGTNVFARDVVAALRPGDLYRRGRLVGTLAGKLGSLEFTEAADARIRKLVDGSIEIVKWRKRRTDPAPVLAYRTCTKDDASLIRDEASIARDIRQLDTLTCYPVLAGRDFEIVRPGWNADTRIYYDQPKELVGDRADPRPHAHSIDP
jgi:hypothetical protein